MGRTYGAGLARAHFEHIFAKDLTFLKQTNKNETITEPKNYRRVLKIETETV